MPGYESFRPFLYFDLNPIFDQYLKIPPKFYFDEKCTSTIAPRPLTNSNLKKSQSTGRNIEVEVKISNLRDRSTEEVENSILVEVQKRFTKRLDFAKFRKILK